MNKFLRYFIAIGLALFTLAACGETEPEQPEEKPKNDKASMLKFTFPADKNPGMQGNSNGVNANGYYCISVT